MGIQSLAELRRNNHSLPVRFDRSSATLVELKRQVDDRGLNSIACKTIDKIEESLGASGGNLVYAGYPYDPFVLDTSAERSPADKVNTERLIE